MSPREKKELVGYLKKESKRLRNAIQQEEEKGNYGKVAHHQHSLDTFQKFLENIYSENKKILFLYIIIQSFLFSSSFSFINNDTALSGKTFIIEVSEKINKEAKLFQYQIAFKDDKLCSKAIGIRHKQHSLPSGFSPGFYSRTIDSSESKATIIFSSLTKKNSGETLLWLGYMEEILFRERFIGREEKPFIRFFLFLGN